MEAGFPQAVSDAADRADAIEAVRGVYGDLAMEIERRRPACIASGRCCRFEEFGHRLFVTTMEMAAFLRELRSVAFRPHGEIVEGPGCPFQVGQLCGVHAIRPFGCRIFFCDETADSWQREQYRIFHDRLRKLHEKMGVAYFYSEWRSALRAVKDLLIQARPNRV